MHGFKTATAQPRGAHEATGLSAAAGNGASCHSPVLLQQRDHISDSPGVDGGRLELVPELNKIASSLLLSSASRAFSLLSCYGFAGLRLHPLPPLCVYAKQRRNQGKEE